MLKFSYSLLFVFAFLFTFFFSPAKTLACGPEPQTIYTLYTRAGNVYVATFNGKVLTSTVQESENYSINVSEAKFTVEKVIKGEKLAQFTVDHRDYVYPTAEGEYSDHDEASDHHLEFGDVDIASLEMGDRVLIFTDRDTEVENRAKMTLTDGNFGVKRLDSDVMEKYVSALDSLHSIYSKPEVDAAQIADWFVRLIEDPETRWEGSYFLTGGLYALKYEEVMKKEAAENKELAEAETDESETESEVATVNSKYLSESDVVKALNDDQRSRLISIAVSVANEGGLASSEAVNGNESLLRFAVYFADHTEINQILSSLYDATVEGYISSMIISEVAERINDKELTKLNEDFANVAYQEPDADFEPQRTEEEMAAAVAEGDGKPVIKMTVGEKRTEILSLFINRTAMVLAQTAQY